jgi:hypothetical protein
MNLAPLMADEAPPAAPSAPASATPPPAATDGAPTPPEAISTESAIEQIDGEENFEALSAMLDEANKPKPPKPETSSAEAPTPPPAEPVATPPASGAPTPPPAAAAPGAPAVEPGEDEVIEGAEENLPKNFRFHTEDPQRSRYLKLLRQRPEANPIDLAREVGYQLPASAAAAAAPAAPTPKEDPLKGLRAEIDALKEQKKTARAAYEFDKVDELQDQILEKTLKLEREQAELDATEHFEAEYQGQYVEARQQAIAKYPDTAKKGTPQAEEVARERAFLEQTEPGFFDDPDYPLALLERLEKRRPDLFKATAPASATPPAAPPPPPPVVTPPPNATPKNAARPVGAAVEPGASGAAQPLSKEATAKAIEEMSIEDLEKLGDAIGTKNTRAGIKTPGVIRG